MTTSDTPGKTPREIIIIACAKYHLALLDHTELGLDKASDNAIAEIVEALHQLHALIRGEVIGEDEDETWYNKDLITPEQKLKEAPIRRRNHLRKQQREALDRLFGIEGGPDGGF